MGKFNLKANHIYTGVEAMTGISQSTVVAAINGDKGAASQILQFSEKAKTQAENAATVIAALEEGINSVGEVLEAESQFLTSASQILTNAQKQSSKVEQVDQKLNHTIRENSLEHKLKLDTENQRHRIALNLLPQQYKTTQTIAEINFKQRRYELTQQVNEARENADQTRQKLTPTQQKLENIRSVSGSVGSGVGGFFGKIFNGLFGA